MRSPISRTPNNEPNSAIPTETIFLPSFLPIYVDQISPYSTFLHRHFLILLLNISPTNTSGRPKGLQGRKAYKTGT